MIYQILYVVCCIYVIFELWRRKAKNTKLRPPMISGGWPLIGHAWKVLGDRKHAFNIVKSMSKETSENGEVMTLKIGPRILYIITDPDDCIKVANECLEKDYYYSFAKPFLGNGLTIADVPTWKQHRKFMSPAFRQQNLNEFLFIFNHQAKRLVDQFKTELGRGSFNHEKPIRLNSLESICLTSFGADVADFSGIHQQYLEAVDESLNIVTERFQKVWLHSDFVYNWSNLKKREEICAGKLKKFTNSILAKRKAEMAKFKTSSDNSGQFTPFMTLLLELSDESGCYSEKDVLYESNTIVSGGYDTSACTNTLVLMMLGSHPEVQAKAYQELQEVFGDSERDVDKDDFIKLVYLDAVLKETMRLYPIAPIIARLIVKDVQLKNYTLEAGNGVGILIWAVHRHPMWGPDADQFRPERWLDGSIQSNTNAFGAFSLGRRSCIGKTYAMMSVKTTLVHILRSYQISSDITKLELEIDALMRPAAGQNISIEERKPMSKKI